MSGTWEAFLLGGVAAGSAIVSLFFVKFWRQTHDALFLTFAASFLVESILCVARLVFVVAARNPEGASLLYGIRLISSSLILVAILRKNYAKRDE